MGASGGLAVCAAALCLSAACAVGAADSVPDKSACRNLVYGDGGLSRSEYLPCAGEMIAALDELEPQSRAALNGDKQKRAEGRATLRRLVTLMKAAGGRGLLERWRDPALTHFNVTLHNAVVRFQAFHMLPVKEEPHMFAAKTREAAAAELHGATRNYQKARLLYRQMR